MPTTQTQGASKEIAHGVVAVYKDHLGRGATDARTTITEDHAVTVLTDSLTKAERSLVLSGDAETVREIRRRFQDAMRSEITELVERVTGREAASFMSDHDVLTDAAVEMVVFKPRPQHSA